MNLTLLASLSGIALLDSLNPSLFLSQFVLLLMPKPVPRILLYIAGILVVNFVGGWLILNGVRAALADFLATTPGEIMFGVGAAIGLIALLFGVLYRPKPAAPVDAKQPRSPALLYSFFFGMIVMIQELTTALPYFVAIEQIGAANLNTPGNLGALVIYNAIFSVPLFGFFGAFLMFRGRFTVQLEKITRWIMIAAPRILKYFSLGLGIALTANAAAFFITRTPLF